MISHISFDEIHIFRSKSSFLLKAKAWRKSPSSTSSLRPFTLYLLPSASITLLGPNLSSFLPWPFRPPADPWVTRRTFRRLLRAHLPFNTFLGFFTCLFFIPACVLSRLSLSFVVCLFFCFSLSQFYDNSFFFSLFLFFGAFLLFPFLPLFLFLPP